MTLKEDLQADTENLGDALRAEQAEIKALEGGLQEQAEANGWEVAKFR